MGESHSFLGCPGSLIWPRLLLWVPSLARVAKSFEEACHFLTCNGFCLSLFSHFTEKVNFSAAKVGWCVVLLMRHLGIVWGPGYPREGCIPHRAAQLPGVVQLTSVPHVRKFPLSKVFFKLCVSCLTPLCLGQGVGESRNLTQYSKRENVKT